MKPVTKMNNADLGNLSLQVLARQSGGDAVGYYDQLRSDSGSGEMCEHLRVVSRPVRRRSFHGGGDNGKDEGMAA